MRKSLTMVALVAVALVILRAHVVLAERGGIPGPPPPPLPPCISTAPFAPEDVPGVVSDVLCWVRNVGSAAHTVTIEIRSIFNTIVGTPITGVLAPGVVNGNIFQSKFGGGPFSCVVTTGEGTTDALGDLSVLLQVRTDDTEAPEGQTQGQIFQQCAPVATIP